MIMHLGVTIHVSTVLNHRIHNSSFFRYAFPCSLCLGLLFRASSRLHMNMMCNQILRSFRLATHGITATSVDQADPGTAQGAGMVAVELLT
jgi:hypothetical protein